jgi:GT2 family glycosyltransferase
MRKKVTIGIVNYNGINFLRSCLTGLTQQVFSSFEIIFLDNMSRDNSVGFVRNNFPDITVVEAGSNLGYAAGANMVIRMAAGDYVMVVNPDVILAPDYLAKCVHRLDQDHRIASVTGKIFKYDFQKNKQTNIIDTIGLFCFRNRRVIDEAQGLRDDGSYDQEQEIFGVSGACPLYRKAALEDVKITLNHGPGEYFDEDFFMYKEDVDLAWRLRLYGWKSLYLPSAVGYHGRGTGVLKRFTHLEVMKNRGKLSRFQKYYSYKNQRLMQIKNETARGLLRDFLPIIWKELLISAYIILREPYLIKAMFHLVWQIPRALKKREIIMRNRRVDWREMEKWLDGQRRREHEQDQ